MSNWKLFLALVFFFSFSLFATSPDWSREARIPRGEDRSNIYQLDHEVFEAMKRRGQIHGIKYPVEVSGLFLPLNPVKNLLKKDDQDPLKKLIQKLTEAKFGIKKVDDIYAWLGLPPFNPENATGIYRIPYPEGKKPDYRVGASVVQTEKGEALTFSCYACHSNHLFGKTVLGLTNKNVRANELFHLAKKTVPFVPNHLFQWTTDATDDEREQFARTKKNLSSVGVKQPQVLGLDTSLAQVALSLSKREPNAYATKSKRYRRRPRKNALNHKIADSKPAVWWNLKYKNRWLSDGSIVSGNPIHTNFLWNEIGRGADLKELEKWMQENQDVIQELTVAAFATEAPRWTDFFSVDTIDLERAKKGEVHFKKACVRCHGAYQKAWNLPDADQLSAVEKLATTKIIYHENTPVRDVGTDPGRYEGMKHFANGLNQLAISKWMKTEVVPQKGYVPNPLVGIWARYPYFHNNSIPSLCDLMTPPEKRTKIFYQGPSINAETDFNMDCIGYPVGENIPKSWKTSERKLDVSKEGLSNQGHYSMFMDEEGQERFSSEEKRELREFLKTL